jgi:hypothetical protein
MKNPLNIGGKIIDAADVHAIKPLSEEQTHTLNSMKNFTAEIRTIGGRGGFVEESVAPSIENVVEAFAKIGEKLTLLPSGEAIRDEWIRSIKPFQSRPDQPNKYGSVVEFKNPATGQSREEWFAAKPEQIPGGKAPLLADLANGPA